MVRREVAELPTLPAQIAAEARKAADAQRTVAQALAPSVTPEDWGVFVARSLAEHASEIERAKAAADEARAVCARAIQRTNATSELLRGCFERAGVSTRTPSYSIVAGLTGGVK